MIEANSLPLASHNHSACTLQTLSTAQPPRTFDVDMQSYNPADLGSMTVLRRAHGAVSPGTGKDESKASIWQDKDIATVSTAQRPRRDGGYRVTADHSVQMLDVGRRPSTSNAKDTFKSLINTVPGSKDETSPKSHQEPPQDGPVCGDDINCNEVPLDGMRQIEQISTESNSDLTTSSNGVTDRPDQCTTESRNDSPSISHRPTMQVDGSQQPSQGTSSTHDLLRYGEEVLIKSGWLSGRRFRSVKPLPDSDFTDDEMDINDKFIFALNCHKISILSDFGCTLPLLTSDLVSLQPGQDRKGPPQTRICIIGLESLDDIKKFDDALSKTEQRLMYSPLKLCYSQKAILYSAGSDMVEIERYRNAGPSLDQRSPHLQTSIRKDVRQLRVHSRVSHSPTHSSQPEPYHLQYQNRNRSYCGTLLMLPQVNGEQRVSTVGGLIVVDNKTYSLTTNHPRQEEGSSQNPRGPESDLLRSGNHIEIGKDWLLVLVQESVRLPNMIIDEAISSPGHPKRRIIQNYCALDSHLTRVYDGPRDVIIATGKSGLRRGVLSKRRTFILSWSKDLQPAWAIKLDSGDFKAGDSGSWVIRQTDNWLLGVLICRSPGGGYMVPFSQVRRDIEAFLGPLTHAVVLLRSEHLPSPPSTTRKSDSYFEEPTGNLSECNSDEDVILIDRSATVSGPPSVVTGDMVVNCMGSTTSQPSMVLGTELTSGNMAIHNMVQPLGTMTTYEWTHGRRCPGDLDVKDVSSAESVKARGDPRDRSSVRAAEVEDEYGMINHPSEAATACAGDWVDDAMLPYDKKLFI